MKLVLIYTSILVLKSSFIFSQTANEFLNQNYKYTNILRQLFKADLANCKRFNYDNAPHGATFDFIIIGAGSTGSVVANRLSENPNWQILLLEAGKTNTIFHDIPIDTLIHQETTSNWGYLSVPQNFACQGSNNHQCTLASGKVLGGTSGINYMKYTRGNRFDYDQWETKGSTGWSYEDVLPYFIKSENMNIKSLRSSPYHGVLGPLNVEPDIVSVYAEQFVKAATQAGHYFNPDNNGRSQMGASYFQSNTVIGHRHGAYNAFIGPILNRQNLHVRTSAQVTKILINPITKVAYGVEFVYKNSTRIVYSSKEVILSAGAFNSPHLLMLSGIGPAELLAKYNVPIIKNLPVGKGLSDHLYFYGLSYTTNVAGPLFPNITINDIKSFLKFKQSILSVIVPQALIFSKVPKSKIPSTSPDIEIIFQIGGINEFQKRVINLKNEIFESLYEPLGNQVYFSVGLNRLQPKSVGTVELSSSNPFVLPKVDPKYLSNREDIEFYLQGIKQIQKIFDQRELQKINVKLLDRPVPGCENFQFASDNYWRCAISTLTFTNYHYCCTCRMGNTNDRQTVVNPELKVHGIDRLRIADASIMPNIISGHLNAACYMIGEKVSDMIKEQWLNFK